MPQIQAGQSIAVHVPATSANLGPGFDVLGLALSVCDTLVVHTQAESGVSVSITGEGAETLPTDETHLIAKTILERWAELGFEPCGLRIEATNNIPHGRGMGSSAAAMVSALAAANALLPADAQSGPEEIFQAASRWEGHPDNVAPAVYGGLTLSWTTDAGFGTLQGVLHSDIVPVIAIPDIELSTAAARGLLPETVPHALAAANGGRVGLLIHALAHEPAALMVGTEDFLHQGFRAPAMEQSAGLIAHLRSAGHAAVVSGAGPTVLVLSNGQDGAQAAAAAISGYAARHAETTWRVRIESVPPTGVRVEVL
ncbi:homoserine kinase [Paeniglutamicibacter sp. ZC-3]|uniref:homoserine kinase n=1 Tax=Paeniglutamicibacter sp. ZC-3 TaxID=2986919 RepID=UPI0021F6D3FB|nr:homoserine kinase [Paeniglutamicibacter sp. ZC-3]MCV9993931.1 homoserine kinase [Paeniglutamicibacter sp. ZC-3]